MVKGYARERSHSQGKDVPSWLAVFRCILLTSVIEGSANVLIEAPVCGVPVVSTVAGGSSETFIDGITGYLYPSQTTPMILQSSIIDSPRQQMEAPCSRRIIRTSF